MLIKDEVYGVGVQRERWVEHSYTWSPPGRGHLSPHNAWKRATLGHQNHKGRYTLRPFGKGGGWRPEPAAEL